MKDLWVLVADADIEATIGTLSTCRQQSLGIRKIEFTITRHPDRDPGCRRKAATMARGFRKDHNHALVHFDKNGSGDESSNRSDIQIAVEKDLYQGGWQNKSKAIVMEPELEAWVWSASNNVGRILGWERTETLREWLRDHQLWLDGETKPPDPKSAMKRAVRERRIRLNSTTFGDLARKVGLKTCKDPAFREMVATLQGWFPASQA